MKQFQLARWCQTSDRPLPGSILMYFKIIKCRYICWGFEVNKKSSTPESFRSGTDISLLLRWTVYMLFSYNTLIVHGNTTIGKRTKKTLEDPVNTS